jgi:lipid-binding SYLF domain-containing protein
MESKTPSYKRSTRLVMAEILTQVTLPVRPNTLVRRFRDYNSYRKIQTASREDPIPMKLKNIAISLLILCLCASTAFAANDEKEAERVKDAGQVLKEILNIPDDIPQDLLDKAECIVILPSVLKGAFGVGGSYGRGVMICRGGEHYTGPWGAPALYALEGVSIGFQLGGQATDFVLLVMNPKGARSLLSSKVKLGADASAAAGPKGRTAEGATDIVMNAEILSYSRNKGLFAGISLEGSTLRSDGSANEKLYGKKVTAKEIIVEHRVGVPACARQLVSLLDSKSPKNKSDPKSLE